MHWKAIDSKKNARSGSICDDEKFEAIRIWKMWTLNMSSASSWGGCVWYQTGRWTSVNTPQRLQTSCASKEAQLARGANTLKATRRCTQELDNRFDRRRIEDAHSCGDRWFRSRQSGSSTGSPTRQREQG